jgi:hypothetical protein
MTTRTIGRHAVTRGTVDELEAAGERMVQVSSHANPNPLCKDGQRVPLDGPLPPYHARCSHTCSPLGFTLGEHVGAMKEVA